VQATRVNDYKAEDILGLVDQRQVGIEVRNSSIPRWRANAQLGWGAGGLEVSWNLRFLSAVTETCANALVTRCRAAATRPVLPTACTRLSITMPSLVGGRLPPHRH